MARSYWGAAGTEPNQFAGWSEARKRFFEQYGYDRGPTPPETTVKVTETPPDDPTPTKRVTTTKYPEGMEQPGMQGDPYAGLLGGQEEAVDPRQALRDQGAFDRLGQGPGTVMGYGDPTWTPEETINLPPTITPEDRFGPQDTIAGAPETSRIDQNRMLLAQQGQQVWHVDEETGEEVTVQDIMDAQDENLALGPMAGSVRVSFNVLKAMDKTQRARYWNYIKNFVRGRGKPAKPTKPKSLDEMVEEKLAIDRAAAAARTAGTAGARTGAQTTAEAANAAKVAKRFKTAVPGAKTVAGTVIAGGLLEKWDGKPYWLEEIYDWGKEFVGGAGEVIKERVVDPSVDLFEELTLTTSEKAASDFLDAQPSMAGEEGANIYAGLLEQSPAAAADTTATDIGQDWDAETGGMLEGEFDQSGMEAWYKSNEAKRKAIEDVARQDAADKQAEIDRYYAKFPEDIEGKRERYLKALNQIYKKVAILNVIAALTNSPSQAGAFMQLAAEKFKTLEGFRGEERLQQIARGVFFDENGVFDAPKDKQDAFNRAMRFGANHDEAMALSGHKKEYAPKATETGVRIWSNAETGQQIWLPKDQAPSGDGWLPTKLDKEAAGTEYERQRANAIELLNAGNEEAAIADLENWFISKNSMMQLMPEQATIIVKYIIDNLKRGIVLSDDEIRNQARVGGAEVDYAYEGVVE